MLLNRFLLAGLLLCSSFAATAQQYFNKRYTLNSPACFFSGIEYVNDTLNVLGCAALGGNLNYPLKYAFSKIDMEGEISSTKVDTLDLYYSYFNYKGFITLQNGNRAFVSGSTDGSSFKNGTLTVIDSMGGRVFSQDYYPDTFARGMSLRYVSELEDNSFFLFGVNDVKINPDKGRFDIIMIKTDSLGNELWRRRFGDGTKQEFFTALEKINDNQYLIHAFKHFQTTYNITIDQWDIIIDSLGNTLSDTVYTDNRIFGNVFHKNIGANRLSVSNYLDGTIKEGTELYTSRRGFISLVAPDQSIIWEKKLGRSSSPTEIVKVIQLADSNFLAVGKTLDSSIFINSLSWSGWLVKFNSSGDVLWERRHLAGVNYMEHYLYDVKELPNGDLVAVGQVIDFFADSNLQQAWLLKMDSKGCFMNDCGYVGIEEQATSPLVAVYPNPAHDIINIVPGAGMGGDGMEVRIYDITGALVHTTANLHAATTTTISVGHLPDSIYLLHVLRQNQIIHTLKILKQ